jgi:hypothetical protein
MEPEAAVAVRAQMLGSVLGSMCIDHLALARASELRGVRVATGYRHGDAQGIARLTRGEHVDDRGRRQRRGVSGRAGGRAGGLDDLALPALGGTGRCGGMTWTNEAPLSRVDFDIVGQEHPVERCAADRDVQRARVRRAESLHARRDALERDGRTTRDAEGHRGRAEWLGAEDPYAAAERAT